MDPVAWGASQWGAFGQVGALLVAVVAGVLVWIQVRQQRHVREEQTRPYVVLDFEFRGRMVMLGVRNIGTTPAKNVQFSFDKPLCSPSRSFGAERFLVFDEPFPMLAPGRRIDYPFGRGEDFFGNDVTVPLQYTVNVRYTDSEGKRKYNDPPMILDLAPFRWSALDGNDLNVIAQRVKGIEAVMKGWTTSGKLNVKTITQAEWDRE